MEGITQAWIEQITLLSSIIGGFSLAIAVELLSGERKQRLASAVITTFVLGASLLLVSTSVGSHILVKMAAIEGKAIVPENLANAVPRIANFIAGVYYVGLGLFISGLGLTGWLQSKVVGIITTAAAVMVGGTVAVLLYTIR